MVGALQADVPAGPEAVVSPREVRGTRRGRKQNTLVESSSDIPKVVSAGNRHGQRTMGCPNVYQHPAPTDLQSPRVDDASCGDASCSLWGFVLVRDFFGRVFGRGGFDSAKRLSGNQPLE